MKKVMLCRGVGTTALKGVVIPNPFSFFRPAQYIGEEPVILRPHVLQTCQGFRLQKTFHEALMKAADSDQTYLGMQQALLKGDRKVDTNFGIEKDLLLYKDR